MSDKFNENSTDAVLSRVCTVLERVEKRLNDGDKKFDELDKRIRTLEKWRYYIIGGAAVVAFSFRAIWDWFVNRGGDGPKH